MIARLCQLKSQLLLMLIILSGCSQFTRDKDPAVVLLTPMKNQWFSKNPEHSLWDQQGKPQPNQFFDVNPQLSKSDVFINAIILVPEGSDHAYQIDIASGQRFHSHSFCPQNDIWKQYSNSISQPNYSVGVIPRLLDQLGEPQKVLIFGGADKFTRATDYHEHRIRLVGAFIEQACPEGNCLGKSNWASRMVFLAVDPKDSLFADVQDMESLQTKIDWVKTKAVIENIDGRNDGGGKSYPSLRVGNLIKITEAMEYYKKNSIYLSDNEAERIRTNCQSLYEKAWTEVGQEREEDKPAFSTDEMNKKVKLITELKKQRKPVGFAARFKIFTEKYYPEYATCLKFVYAGNVNKNSEKFWFLSYLGLYLRLHRDGFFYDCNRNSWQTNIIDSQGKAAYDFKTGILNCNDKNFDQAMNALPTFLTGIKSSSLSYYKFLDYDTHSFGTHQKLYSWVKLKSRKYDCKYDPNELIKKEIKVFPDDVSWKPRQVKDIGDELKIIY